MHSYHGIQTTEGYFQAVRVHPKTWEILKAAQNGAIARKFSFLVNAAEHFHRTKQVIHSNRIRKIEFFYKFRLPLGLRVPFYFDVSQKTGKPILHFGRIYDHDAALALHHNGAGSEFVESIVLAADWQEHLFVEKEEPEEAPAERVFLRWDFALEQFINKQPDACLMMDLDEEQWPIVESEGPVFLNGSAGSGKTTIAIYRLALRQPIRAQIEERPARKLYVTLTESLRDFAKGTYHRLALEKDAHVEFKTLEELCKELCPGKEFPVEKKLTARRFKARGYKRFNPKLEYDPDDVIWEEIQGVIKGDRRVLGRTTQKEWWLTLREYEAAGTASIGVSAEVVYGEFESLRSSSISGYWDELDLAREAYGNVMRGAFQPYDEVVIDEAQDLTAFHLAMLFKLCYHPAGLFLSGDVQQSIHPSRFTWKDCRAAVYEQTGKPQDITSIVVNYRCPGSVVKWASEIIAWRLAHFQDEEGVRLEPAKGGEPIYWLPTSEILPLEVGGSEQLMVIVMDERAKEEAVAIFGEGYVFTVFEAKGLERDYVVLWKCLSANVELWSNVDYWNQHDESKLESNKKAIKFLLNCWNVAMTRAKETLFVMDDFEPGWEVFQRANFETGIRSHERLTEVLSLRGQHLSESAEELHKRDLEVQAAAQYKAARQWDKAADIYFALERWEDAGDCYSAAGEISLAKEAWAQAAIVAEGRNQWVKALQCYGKAGHGADQHRCLEQLARMMKEAQAAETESHWREAGSLYEAAERFDDAIRCYSNGGDWEAAGHLYGAANDWTNAAACYEKAKLWILASRSYERVGSIENAASCLEQAASWSKAAHYYAQLENWPKLGLCRESLKQWKFAVDAYSKAQDWLAVGRCLEALGDLGQAAEHYQRAESWDKAAETQERFAKTIDPVGRSASRKDAFRRAAQWYRQVSKWQRAAACFTLAEYWSDAASCFEAALDWRAAGATFYRIDDWQNAARCFDMAQEWSRVGECHVKLRQWDLAWPYFSRAKQWEQAAECLLKLREWEQAGDFFVKAKKWEAAGNCFSEANLWERAIECFVPANKFERVGDCYWTLQRWEQAGQAYVRARLWERACTCYEVVRNWQEAAMCARQAKQYSRALKHFKRIKAWREAGECLVHLEKKEKAAAYYEIAKEWEIAGNCYEDAGKWEQAGNCYRTGGRLRKAGHAFSRALRFSDAGQCFFECKSWEEAAEAFADGKDWENAGKAFEQTKRLAEAADCYQRAKNWEAALRCSNQMINKSR
jgi:tetratricopeptide (TPR) repeat protein